MKKYIVAGVLGLLLLPSVTLASNLSTWQINAILGLLQAFNVDQSVLVSVQSALVGTSTPTLDTSTVTVSQPTTSTTSPTVVYMPIYVNTGSAPVSDVTPQQKFMVFSFTEESPTDYYISASKEIDLSSIKFTKGIFSTSTTSGECSGSPNEIRKCLDWSITEELPITVSETFYHVGPNLGGGHSCDGQTGICDYPIYRVKFSRPLSDFIDSDIGHLPFILKISSKDGDTLTIKPNYYPGNRLDLRF